METKRIKLEVEIPTVIYMALLENKMRDQEDILERARKGTVAAFYAMYRNPSLVPVPLRQYFEANYGAPPELPAQKKRVRKRPKKLSQQMTRMNLAMSNLYLL